MTNSPILVRYVSEVAYRCCLTLSLYSRPHSSECAINEHRAIIAALVKGDESKVMGLMHSHLNSVANRALVAPAPQRGRDLLDILAPYAEESDEWPRGEDAEGDKDEVEPFVPAASSFEHDCDAPQDEV